MIALLMATGPAIVPDPEPALKVVCAWCATVMVDGPPEPISHGICETCIPKFEAGERPAKVTP